MHVRERQIAWIPVLVLALLGPLACINHCLQHVGHAPGHRSQFVCELPGVGHGTTDLQPQTGYDQPPPALYAAVLFAQPNSTLLLLALVLILAAPVLRRTRFLSPPTPPPRALTYAILMREFRVNATQRHC